MAKLSDVARKTLPLVMNAQHLDAAPPCQSDSNPHWIVDQFLTPPMLAMIRDVVATAGQFEDNLKLYSQARAARQDDAQGIRGEVDRATFEAADSEDHFIHQRRLVGMRPGQEDSSAAKGEAFFRRMLSGPAMHEWLEMVTGIAVSQTGGINLKLHGPGDLLAEHSDARAGRKLCGVLYAHEDWQPAYGARFSLRLADGQVRLIDPLPNRLILFDVTTQNLHQVTALGEVPEGWMRVNYSVWFG